MRFACQPRNPPRPAVSLARPLLPGDGLRPRIGAVVPLLQQRADLGLRPRIANSIHIKGRKKKNDLWPTKNRNITQQ